MRSLHPLATPSPSYSFWRRDGDYQGCAEVGFLRAPKITWPVSRSPNTLTYGHIYTVAHVGEGMAMAKPLLPDELWELIRPLIPPHPPQPKGGRPWLDDRKALTGIIFVLKTGLPWEDLPQEMGCGCGMTCWNRLRDW